MAHFWAVGTLTVNIVNIGANIVKKKRKNSEKSQSQSHHFDFLENLKKSQKNYFEFF